MSNNERRALEMTILEFIEQQYPIRQRVQERLQDPYKRIADSDDLPYDIIGPDEFGNVTKLVEIDTDRYISVMELIGYTQEEIDKSEDSALIIAYDAYMSQVDFEDLNILDIMESVRMHSATVSKRKEKLDVLSL